MNKTLSVFAILAAAALVAGTFAVFATSAVFAQGDGNTIIHFRNSGKASSSGFGTTAANIQSNCLRINSNVTCG